MITVTFLKSANLLYGFKISGHSGYAEQGSDIVCAAVSSASVMAANTITEIQHIGAEVTDGDGFLSLKLPLSEADKACDIMQGLLLHMTALCEQYKKFIKLKISEV